MTPEARLTALLVTGEEASRPTLMDRIGDDPARERSEQVRARVRARLARYAASHQEGS